MIAPSPNADLGCAGRKNPSPEVTVGFRVSRRWKNADRLPIHARDKRPADHIFLKKRLADDSCQRILHFKRNFLARNARRRFDFIADERGDGRSISSSATASQRDSMHREKDDAPNDGTTAGKKSSPFRLRDSAKSPFSVFAGKAPAIESRFSPKTMETKM
jgi:hypothetical protein